MDLEKAYDRVDREVLLSVLKIYGVSGQLLRGASPEKIVNLWPKKSIFFFVLRECKHQRQLMQIITLVLQL